MTLVTVGGCHLVLMMLVTAAVPGPAAWKQQVLHQHTSANYDELLLYE
jgi:hypothetical protein